MVAKTVLEGRAVSYCEVCGLAFEDARTATACEEHCRTHSTCSLELARRAVGAVDVPDAA